MKQAVDDSSSVDQLTKLFDMSLVSTINEEKPTNLLNSAGNTESTVIEAVSLTGTQEKPNVAKSARGFSVYHRNGDAQLSKEALYRAKVKYGIYQSPARSFTTGLAEPKVASDVAANLANDKKYTIEAYKRLFVDPNAHRAARKSLANGGPRVKDIVIPESHYGSHQAATRAYSVAGKETTKRLQEPVSPPGSRRQSLKSANAAYYHTKLPEPDEIAPKPVGKKPMDMSKILSSAENHAQTRVTDRLDHAKVSEAVTRSAQNLQKVRSTSLTGAVYKERKDAKEQPARPRPDAKQYAQWAAFAMKDRDPVAIANREFEQRQRERGELLTQITSLKVLTKARENADKQIEAIDAQDIHRLLFGNEAYNRAAIEIAQGHAQKAAAETDVHEGKINIGGGLWLSPDDVHNIAKEMVDPLLGEVSERAEELRATDAEIKERNDYVTNEWNAWTLMHQTKENNNEALLVNSYNKRTKEADAARNEAETKLAQLCGEMDEQVAERTDALNQTRLMTEQLERETEERLAKNKEENKTALRDLKTQRRKELDEAKEEQTDLIQPYKDRLEEANRQHEALIQEHAAINEEIFELRESIQGHKDQLAKYEAEIKDYEEQNADVEEQVKNLETDKEGLKTHYDNTLALDASRAKEQAQLSGQEARLQTLEVDRILNERKTELTRTEQELQREKLNMLEAMRKTAEARGDEGIDEDRVKQLIGMTSSDYIKKQKKARKSSTKKKAAEAGQDDEANAKEFREIAKDKAAEAKEKHTKTVADSAPTSPAKSVSKDKPSSSTKPKSSDDTEQKLLDKAQSSYFKEVF